MNTRLGILDSGKQWEKAMHKNLSKLDTLFGGVIHRYTRAQALADGLLVDVTETAQEAGFRVPVAMTASAWNKAVAWSDTDSTREAPQDESSRLWDVVWMACITARRANGSCRVPFHLYVVPRGGAAKRQRLMTLHMHIGPGDKAEPVITIMNPDED